MLLTLQKSCLLIVDVQEKLTPSILNHQTLIENCEWLIRLARELGVPIHVSEQYPQGLGKTVMPLQQHIATSEYSSKVHFSCAADVACREKIFDLERPEIVIAGIETHVCILQTAIELKALGKTVFIVVDAVGSRHELNHRYGLKRMKAEGIQLVTREMVFFEWLRQAGTPRFKELSKNFLTTKKYTRDLWKCKVIPEYFKRGRGATK